MTTLIAFSLFAAVMVILGWSSKPPAYFPATSLQTDISLPSTGSGRPSFPRFISTIKMLRLPAAHLAALRFLRLAIPRPFVNEGLSNPVTPGSGRVETMGSPKFLGKPRLSLCTGSPTPVGPVFLANAKHRHGPRSLHDKGYPQQTELSGLYTLASRLAVYASPRSLPPPTQDSLPVVGQTLLDGLSTRKASFERFPSMSLHLFLPSQALTTIGLRRHSWRK